VLTAAIVSLLIGSQGWHGAILLPVAAALFVLFILIERRVREPILPIDLFMQRVIAVSSATSALAGAAMFSMITYVPLYVQGVLGGDPTDAGAAIGPMVVAWPIASAVAGRLLTKIGFRPLIRIGLLLVALSSIALALLLRPGAPVWIARVVAIGFGTGLGLSQTASLIAVQSSVGFEQRGVATSSTMFFRIIGSTLGVGALGAVLAATFRATAASVSPELVNQMLGPERRSLDPAVLRSMSGTLQAGLGTIFWSICALSIAAFVVGLFFPPLSTKDRAVAVATTDEAAPISGPIELG
jgi:predicted MFS family arabinose efflux permease